MQYVDSWLEIFITKNVFQEQLPAAVQLYIYPSYADYVPGRSKKKTGL